MTALWNAFGSRRRIALSSLELLRCAYRERGGGGAGMFIAVACLRRGVTLETKVNIKRSNINIIVDTEYCSSLFLKHLPLILILFFLLFHKYLTAEVDHKREGYSQKLLAAELVVDSVLIFHPFADATDVSRDRRFSTKAKSTQRLGWVSTCKTLARCPPHSSNVLHTETHSATQRARNNSPPLFDTVKYTTWRYLRERLALCLGSEPRDHDGLYSHIDRIRRETDEPT